MPVVQEGDDQRVLEPDARRVPSVPVQVIARQEEIAQDRPGSGAVDEDVSRFHHREGLLRRYLSGDALNGARVTRVDQFAERMLDCLQRHEPARPFLEQASQVRSDRSAVRHPCLELGRLEDGLDVLPVDHVRLVALERIGNEVRGERHHPGTRVLGSAFVEADRVAVDRLEKRRQEQADRSGTDDVDSTLGTRGLAHRDPERDA